MGRQKSVSLNRAIHFGTGILLACLKKKPRPPVPEGAATAVKNYCATWKLSTKQSQHGLRSRVGLRDRCGTGLQQDLRLAQVGGFGSQIGVTNARFGGCQVGQLRLRQVYSVRKLVLGAADGTLNPAEVRDGGRERCNSAGCVACAINIHRRRVAKSRS